jgi:hypothetical protein
MIIGFQTPQTIGEVITAKVNGPDGLSRPAQPFLIVRETTREEWIKWCKETSATAAILPPHLSSITKFYEVSTD